MNAFLLTVDWLLVLEKFLFIGFINNKNFDESKES
jgi:hypothetical protein